MTDNEIIKALECCKINDCENCPYENLLEDSYGCVIMSTIDAIELIKRQQEEIEDKFEIIGQQGRYIKGLKEENEKIKTKIYKMAIDKALAEKARTEAIKEFAEKLKEEIRDATDCNYEVIEEHNETHKPPNAEFVGFCNGKILALRGIDDYIDDLVKEMGCGE